MIEMTWSEPERVCAFVASQPGFERDLEFGECQALGILIGGELIAGVVFQNWNPKAGTIEISAAATDSRWMTRKSLQRIFGYVFDGAGCQLCILQVSEANERMRSIARRLGFTEHVIPRLFGRQTGGVVCTLTAEQWASSPIRSRREQAKSPQGT
jgi:RimJ/RimL family protein N-acetyltransferase